MEWFTKKEREKHFLNVPAVKINVAYNTFRFNNAAVVKFNLRDWPYVDMGMDVEEGIIGFELKKEKGYRTLSTNKGTRAAVIACGDFIEHFELKKSSWMLVTEKDGYLIATLAKEEK